MYGTYIVYLYAYILCIYPSVCMCVYIYISPIELNSLTSFVITSFGDSQSMPFRYCYRRLKYVDKFPKLFDDVSDALYHMSTQKAVTVLQKKR